MPNPDNGYQDYEDNKYGWMAPALFIVSFIVSLFIYFFDL